MCGDPVNDNQRVDVTNESNPNMDIISKFLSKSSPTLLDQVCDPPSNLNLSPMLMSEDNARDVKDRF